MGANHNEASYSYSRHKVVSNVPKILKWEQITTRRWSVLTSRSCFQCSKDTKMGANHNLPPHTLHRFKVVSNVPKILKWEQITTKETGLNGYL